MLEVIFALLLPNVYINISYLLLVYYVHVVGTDYARVSELFLSLSPHHLVRDHDRCLVGSRSLFTVIGW